jgi:NADH-quinone oxidoreductase subunit L
MPITYWTMLIGALALAGCPPFSGFFSKDEILYLALANGFPGIWAIGILVAGITAYYTFRMIFLVFHGEARDKEAFDHAHEAPAVMTVPLIILAVGALFAGFLNLPGFQPISHWLSSSVVEHHPHSGLTLEILTICASVAAFALGIIIAYKKFGKGAEEPVYTGFAQFSYNLFYVDQLYHHLLVKPYQLLGSAIQKTLEPFVVDGHVKISTWLYQISGNIFKVFQVGYVRVYAIYMVIGLSLMSLFLSQTLN